VAHTCYPSYSRGRDQEDHGSKPTTGKSFERPYLGKKPITHTQNGWQSGSGCKSACLANVRP
jgi:hypothetical protein